MFEAMQAISRFADAALIYWFRIPENPVAGYFLGVFFLCLVCVLIGQATVMISLHFNGKLLSGEMKEMVRLHNLSVRALFSRDKTSYKACNKEANDAFGKFFFANMAVGLTGLWPLPFALDWMQGRFAEVSFALPVSLPLFGDSVGYIATVLPAYILTYILFGKVRKRIPFIQNRIASAIEPTEEVLPFAPPAS